MTTRGIADAVPPIAASIVVPVYNAARHLPAALDSVLAQDPRDIEVIAIDDGSTDGSEGMLAARAALDPRLVVVAHEGRRNRGVAASRNLGLRHARGEFLWFVDADDRIRPHAISALLACARSERADVVAFNGEECGGGLPNVPVYRQPKPQGVVTGETWVARGCRQKEWRHFLWLRFYRRAYLHACRLAFREGIVHEDIGWITEGDLRAARFAYLDRTLYEYVRTPDSLTRVETDAALMHRAESMFEVIGQLRDINRRCPMGEDTRRLLRAELVGQGIGVDRLRRRIADPSLRKQLGDRIRRERFWQLLWPDAVSFTRKRQLARILWRERFGA
jgi:glycosyltransferase involved in cell wall biosynthesis